MATRTWQPVHYCFCHHVDQVVVLEADVVYPPDILPDREARVLAHRCSMGIECNLEGRASCVWAGTNPTFDPFLEL